MKKRLSFNVTFALLAAVGWWVVALAQTTAIVVTPVNNVFNITAAALKLGLATSARAYDVGVSAGLNFAVSVRLNSILVSGIASTIPPAALSLTAHASGAPGTTNVTVAPFQAFNVDNDLSGAFSGLAGATNETSQIDLQINLSQLGNRTQGETLDFQLTFTVVALP